MPAFDSAAPPAQAASHALPFLRRSAPALFAATLFFSALLLFAVQPMFTKMVLPRLGGSPSVWSVAMVAFQTFLFIGYVYAHVLTRTLSPRWAALVHLAFLALVASSLPLGIAKAFDVPPADGVMVWLIGLFAASIGLPFIALSATAPLLQSWFVATGRPQARTPYVLYAASNLGSFCALLAYPFALEPFLSLHTQVAWWSAGFAILSVGICLTALTAVHPFEAHTSSPAAKADPPIRRRVSEWATWTVLMGVPAGLCIAVTAFITTDLAAAPFLWVLPLALYLLTFVAVFRETPWISHALVLRLLPYVIAPLAISVLGGDKLYWFAIIALNLVAFVLIALACHGEAYARRPEPNRLTEFYLWTSFGGVVGGVFAGLVAPNIFNNIYEYPILIAAALLAMPGMFAGGTRRFMREAAAPLIAAVLVVVTRLLLDVRLPSEAQPVIEIALVLLAALMLLQARRPARFFGYVVLAFAITAMWRAGVTTVETARSFFGVNRVVETADGAYRLLYHGTTIHGAERVRDAAGASVSARPVPLTYYYFGGPISEAVDAARNARGHFDRVAAVGLGTGSMACHKRDGERWTFFEIDPVVIRLASDEKNFRFLSACGPVEHIVPGDARLTLAASSGRYDLIVLDAFSSDAIPVHLLTREAFAGYLTRLAPNGVIAVHVSNRHMELASVVAAVGAAEGLIAYVKQDDQANDLLKDYRANAQVVVLAKSVADLGNLPSRRGWTRLDPMPGVTAWTDDYSDVLRAILRKALGH
jgi:predicted O-methyltransferase YrrM